MEESWGQRVRRLQERLGVTTAQIALRLRISEGSIYALLRSPDRTPSKIVQQEIQALEKELSEGPIHVGGDGGVLVLLHQAVLPSTRLDGFKKAILMILERKIGIEAASKARLVALLPVSDESSSNRFGELMALGFLVRLISGESTDQVTYNVAFAVEAVSDILSSTVRPKAVVIGAPIERWIGPIFEVIERADIDSFLLSQKTMLDEREEEVANDLAGCSGVWLAAIDEGRRRGRVEKWLADAGIGFIAPADSPHQPLFFEQSGVKKDAVLREDAAVTFSVIETGDKAQGKPGGKMAVDVELAGDEVPEALQYGYVISKGMVFGFVRPDDKKYQPSLFFSVSDTPFTEYEELNIGDRVGFLIGKNSKGNKAVKVRRVPE